MKTLAKNLGLIETAQGWRMELRFLISPDAHRELFADLVSVDKGLRAERVRALACIGAAHLASKGLGPGPEEMRALMPDGGWLLDQGAKLRLELAAQVMSGKKTLAELMDGVGESGAASAASGTAKPAASGKKSEKAVDVDETAARSLERGKRLAGKVNF